MPIEPNFRYIAIDEDTEVGYNYPQAQFYVTNKETTTYRDTEEAIEIVLQAIGIVIGETEDIHGELITTARIEALKDNVEVLETDTEDPSMYTGIKYTWDETGSYIHSIQFNKWDKYPIIMDCNKAKLYILNSTTIFDLTTNESPEYVRIPILCSFYQQTLGIEIPKEIMLAIYNLLLSYYNPNIIVSKYKPFYLAHLCTNQINEREDTTATPTYSNTFSVSNFANNTPVVYSCTNDPYNTTNPTEIGYIVEADSNNNTITLTKSVKDIPPFEVKAGSKVIIKGASTTVDNTTYNLDGTYTIYDINTDRNIITLEETLPTSYSFPFYTCHVVDGTYTISSMNRDSNTIVVTTNPDSIIVGDTITVTGATVSNNFSTISLDGNYTVQSIQAHTITVVEPIETNYTGSATLTKELFLGNIIEVEDEGLTIKLLNPVEEYMNKLNNLVSPSIIVYNNSMSSRQKANVSSVDLETSTLTLTTPIVVEEGYPTYPQLQYPTPNTDMLIDISYTEYSSTLPIGQFIVDNFNQVISYLNVEETVTLPTVEADEFGNRSIKDSMYNELASSIRIPVEIKGQDDPQISIMLNGNGIYQEVYNEIEGNV